MADTPLACAIIACNISFLFSELSFSFLCFCLYAILSAISPVLYLQICFILQKCFLSAFPPWLLRNVACIPVQISGEILINKTVIAPVLFVDQRKSLKFGSVSSVHKCTLMRTVMLNWEEEECEKENGAVSTNKN